MQKMITSRVFTMCHAMALPYSAVVLRTLFISSYSLHYFSVDIAL